LCFGVIPDILVFFQSISPQQESSSSSHGKCNKYLKKKTGKEYNDTAQIWSVKMGKETIGLRGEWELGGGEE
jgi:hypothetical protein